MGRRLEQFLRLLAPLLLLLLGLLRLLAMVLLQQLLELGTYWRLPHLCSRRQCCCSSCG